ncbi:hypothetical protein AARAC_006420 [Aspergillus arachidicola]|uniref:Uncharacterized protein n=1 Tax=Aspergillus arachidicola TaxID=656916 RepID=A0A2G7FQ36_9EURO|nr:hypothetical protein AARAC_006420 [Aspergillus arachidicola]
MLETIHMDLRWRGHTPYGPQPRAVFSHITDDLYRLEKSLLGLVHAVSRGQFPGLEEVRWDQNEELSSECEFRVRKGFAEAGVSLHYDSWPTTSTTFGDGGGLPAPNYKNPFPLPREEDYEDL